jgi:hypothetical protein
MGCGCNKNKQNNEQSGPEFKSETNTQQTQNILSRKIGMIQSFATALTSRGLSNNKVNKPTKQLRVLSCFGNKHLGGELPPCEHLKESSTPGKHFCGGCGCGDKPHTWLMSEGQEYSKLDYPKLVCPLNMPGFTNYQPSKPDEAQEPITRRYYIENLDYNIVANVPVTLPETPPPPPTPQPGSADGSPTPNQS